MQFNAPEVVTNIRDIREIYEMNDDISPEEDLEILADDIFIDTSHENKISRFEKIMGYEPLDTDSIEVRRARIKAKVNEKLPFTIRTIIPKLNAICGVGRYWIRYYPKQLRLEIYFAPRAYELVAPAREFLEEVVPLAIYIHYEVYTHTYEDLEKFTYGEMEQYSYEDLTNYPDGR